LESARARDILSRATRIDTVDMNADLVAFNVDGISNPLTLRASRKIRTRHLKVFGRAAQLGIPSFTSDYAFVRASKQQGVDLESYGLVVLNAPRSLTGL